MTQDDFCTIFTETNRQRQIPLSLRGLEPWEQPHSGSLSNWGSASGPRRPRSQRATGAQGTRGPDSSPPPPPPSASCARAAYCPSTAINDDDFNNGGGGGASSFPSAPVRPPARDADAGQDRFRCFLPGLQVTFTPASRTGIPSPPLLGFVGGLYL